MQLLIIRHAIAEERDEFAEGGQSDSERPLTDFGRRRMRKNAKGLRRVAPRLDLLATSPFTRAAETAAIVAKTLGLDDEPTVVDSLTPEHHPRDFLAWLATQDPAWTVAAVGHDPHLPRLIGWCLAGQDAPMAELKKGGACLLSWQASPGPEVGKATLLWTVTPAQLRAIAD
jgi:phosphohistidine phosphatase